MAKNKSSASAGTRKKHAAKKSHKDQPEDLDQEPPAHQPTKMQRGQKKLTKAQRKALPKIKQYVPPPKAPAPPIPDPLDGQGLARTLPAELVVVLRRLGKKDDVTRRKGLDELRDEWVKDVMKEAASEEEEIDREIKEIAILSAIPVWFHNLASLLQSPFHRFSAIQLQADLLSIPSLRSSILETLNLGLLPGTQNRDALGSWMVAALEEGRRAASSGLKGWEASTTWICSVGDGPPSEESTEKIDLAQQLPSIIEYLTLSILDPASLHESINPAPVASSFAPQSSTPKKGANKGSKGTAPQQSLSRQATTPIPVSEQEEVVEERLTRYRVGGLISLTWILQQLPKAGITTLPDGLLELLRNAGLWLALSPEAVESHESLHTLGTAQSPVRRAAYALLTILVDHYEAVVAVPETLEMLSNALLGSCWAEREAIVWEAAGPAVAKFLKKWPECWSITARRVSRKDLKKGQTDDSDDGENLDEDDEGEDEDEDEDEDDDEDDLDNSGSPTSNAQEFSSPYYPNFLDFASNICPSIPHLTYPILIVIISTLPHSLLPFNGSLVEIQTLFSHLWSPVDARLLSTHSLPGKQSAFQVFFSALLECTLFLILKSWRSEDGKKASQWLVTEQLGQRAWQEGVLTLGGKAGRRASRGTVDETEAAVFGSTLGRLVTVDESLLEATIAVLRQALIEACFPTTEFEGKAGSQSILSRSLPVLLSLRGATNTPAVVQLSEAMAGDVAKQSAEVLRTSLEGSNPSPVLVAETLVEALRSYPSLIEETINEDLCKTFQAESQALLAVLSPSLFVTLCDLLCSHSKSSSNKEIYPAIIDGLLQSTDTDSIQRFAVADALLALDAKRLLRSDSLDNIVSEAAQEALSTGSTTASSVVTASLENPAYMSRPALDKVLELTCTVIHDSTEKLLTKSFTVLGIPRAAFDIFTAYAVGHLEEVIESESWIQSLVAVHHVLFVLPRVPGHIATQEAKVESLRNVWSKLGNLSETAQKKLLHRVHMALREEIQRVDVYVDPEVLVDVALATTIGTAQTPLVEELAAVLLPPTEDVLSVLASHASRPPHPSLPIADPLIHFMAPDNEEQQTLSSYDTLGRSQAARSAEASVSLLRADRSLVKSQPALLQIALAVGQLARDALAVPGASRGLFTKDTPAGRLTDLVREVEGASSFALGYVDEVEPSWHATTVQALKTGTLPSGADLLQRLLVALKEEVVSTGGDVSARSFRDILNRHLRQVGAAEKECEPWLAYAMTLVDRAPQLSMAIILAIKQLMLDTPPFMTSQNRLASALTTVPASQCHKSLNLLRIFNASAPPADSASVFLSQQRALFVLRHVAGWLTSDDVDEDQLPEDMECRVLEMEAAIAPIVQDVSGGHWDGIFDLVESGLENSTMDDPASSCLLYQSLTVLQQIRDLCQMNKSLRASWTSKDVHMKLVLDLFLQCRQADTLPLQLIQSLILDLLPDIPEKVMENAPLSSLCTLISFSTSSPIQTAAYRILSRVIKHQTLALVLEVEASVAQAEEGHAERTIELAKELLDVVKIGSEVDWHGQLGVPVVVGQLLAWMSILDYFEDASRTLRWAYLDQLNTSKLITEGLIPMLFSILGVSEVGAWNFPASQYAVDEFFTELLDPEDLSDLAPLASHIFYRALITIPSSFRSYYESLKDRQLSMSMLNFTARHYSPVIIAHEFSALRQPAAMAQLTEEGLNVRIAQGGGATVAANSVGSAEAIASYVVDEQPMEIGIRLPAEFPLKGVDVRDLRRVGVPENKWRGWLMSVQQTITSRNGLILEALTVFKKNVSLHFEGVVECAICYSIISVTDRTLPTKPCRTCKNRFHASCLFKWFNSSHSSSCPLCRALF